MNSMPLIREWLTYFHFPKDTSLIIDEWNFDRSFNTAVEREKDAFIAASFIPARIRGMYEEDLDYQLYFSLEDFQSNKEGVLRNTGIFWYDASSSAYKGGPKVMMNVFNMLSRLGKEMFQGPDKFKDDFAGIIASKDKDFFSILIYNYIDPQADTSFLTRAMGTLNGSQRKIILGLINSEQYEKIMRGEIDIARLRLDRKTTSVLKRAKELQDKAADYKSLERILHLGIKNINGNYLYQRYTVDSSCSRDCAFSPVEEKEISIQDSFQEALSIKPYSVNLILLRQKPKEEAPPVVAAEPLQNQTAQEK